MKSKNKNNIIIQPPFLSKKNISHMEHDLNGNMDEEQKFEEPPHMCWLLLYFMKQKITTEFF